jgi:hypothetical protein
MYRRRIFETHELCVREVVRARNAVNKGARG